MSEITVGSVAVEIVPDARNFPRRTRQQVDPEAARIGQEFGRRFGDSASDQMAKGVREGLRSGGRESSAQGARQGQDFGGAFARALKTRLEAAFRSLPDVEIDADSTGADREIAALKADLETLRDKRIGIDIDAASAMAEVDRLTDQLRLLGQQSPDVQVRIEAGAATAELERFQAEVRRLDGQTANVRVDADTAGASAQLALMNAEARGAGAGFASLLGIALLLGPALIPIGAAGVGAMGALLAGALAAAGGLGVLLLALTPIVGAVQAVRAAHDKSAQSARGATSAHLQMASAMDSVRSANRALASAEEDARIQRIQATEAIADAERNLANAKRQAAQDAVDADRRVEDAERSVADAQRDALNAQRALADARRQAALDAEDLAARVAGGILDEQDAQLRLAEARKRAEEVARDPNATELERQRANLAVAQAIQGLKDQQRENERLREQKTAADEAGIEGSKRVRDAQDQVRESQRKLADAQEAVTLAVEAASERRRKAAESVAQAQRQVATATRNAEVQQRRSAEAIASAQQAVVSAQRGVQQASQSAGAAGGSALETMRQKLAALSPAGRNFVTFLTGTLFPALKPLGDAAQTAVLPGLQQALKDLMPAIPGLRDLITSFGKAIGGLAVDAVKSFKDPVWQSFFGYLKSDGASILVTVAKTVGNLAKGFAGLFVAFKPVTDQILGGLLRLSRRFADFGANAGPETGLGKFIGYIRDNGPKVVTTFGDIFLAVGNIARGLAPLGPVVLAVVDGLAKMIAAVPPTVLGAIAAAVISIVAAIRIWTIVQTILNTVLAANPISLIVLAIIGLVAAFVMAYKNSETFRDIVNGVWDAVTSAISTAWEFIRGVFAAIVGFLSDKLGPVFRWLYDKVIHPVWTAIRVVIDTQWALIKVIFGTIEIAIKALGMVFSWLYDHAIKPAWDKIYPLINGVWVNFVKPLLDTIGGFIEDHVAPAFSRGVDAIGRAWDGIKAAAKAPVKFVIDTVINRGIIGTFNKVADFFHVAKVDEVKLPAGFATGGYVSGPGGPREDKIPAMLSNGEFVINAAAVRAVGLDFLNYINGGGSIGGDAGGTARFAAGGQVNADRIRQTVAWIPSVDPLPYRWGAVGPNSFDCSGLAGEVWARVLGKARNTRYFTTSSNLRSLGFAPGTGTLTLGLNPGQHVVGNLAGEGFEARSTLTGIFTGLSATPPRRMQQQWYLASMPGSPKGKGDGGIDWFNPLDSFKGLFDGILDVGHRFDDNPFGRLAMAAPKALISGAGDFISDHVPGFADGGLVAYDNGGYIPPGVSAVYNGTGKPEPVFTDAQWSQLKSSGAGGQPVYVTQNITNPAPERHGDSLATGLRKIALFGLVGKP
jgi:phage-related protein